MSSRLRWDDDWVRRRLRLRDIHYLLAVAQAGSMAQAASLLSVSQPVVSKAIADMEYILGVRLLDRSPHGVEPTIYGRALLGSSHAIFDELRQGVKDVGLLSDPLAGELSIGSNETSTVGIVPTVVKAVYAQRPRLKIKLAEANKSVEQRRELRERRVEFCIGRIGYLSSEEEFETEVLFHQSLFVVAGMHNPWTRRSQVDLAELLDEPWVMPPKGSESGRLVAEAFRLCGLRVPRAKVYTSSLRLHSHLLESGPFLSILPVSVLPPLSNNSRLRSVLVSLPLQDGPVGVIKLRSRNLSPAAKLFIDITRSVVKSMRSVDSE